MNTISSPFLLLTKVCESDGDVSNLASFIEKKAHAQPGRVCFELLLSLCDALIHIHASNILHNDLKPNNVAIDEIHDVKRCVLLDFGKACFIKDCKGKLTPKAAGSDSSGREDNPFWVKILKEQILVDKSTTSLIIIM